MTAHLMTAHLPLRVLPERDTGVDTLIARLPQLRDDLTRIGALLLRGWAVNDPADFERVCRALSPSLQNTYLGTSPRNALTPYVFTASELPSFYPIPQHNEMSFTRTPPDLLFFVCLRPNRAPGGETPLCDMRRVWARLPSGVQARFQQNELRFVRNYVGPGAQGFDPWKLKRWDEMFGTTDKAEVERVATEQGFEVAWVGERLRLSNVQAAVRPHPQTGEPVWFNHSQVFHVGSAAAEYRRIGARMGWRWTFWGWVAAGLAGMQGMFGGIEHAAMHCTYADGSAIPEADLEAVRDAIWAEMVAIPWEKGDVMVIDNASVAHGRLPYDGDRLIAVAWA